MLNCLLDERSPSPEVIEEMPKRFKAEMVRGFVSDAPCYYELNNTQLGLAILLADGVQQKVRPRQVVALPSGLGKSRVIFGVIVALFLGVTTPRIVKSVEVVYNHISQLKDEEKKLAELATFLKITITTTLG